MYFIAMSVLLLIFFSLQTSDNFLNYQKTTHITRPVIIKTFLCPYTDRWGGLDFCPASLSLSFAFVSVYKKRKKTPMTITLEWQVIELSYFTFLFPVFFGNKVKVICLGQGQIPRSHFSLNGCHGDTSVS